MALLCCASCGLPMGDDDAAPGPSPAMLEHIRVCEAHPYHALQVEMARYVARVKELEADLAEAQGWIKALETGTCGVWVTVAPTLAGAPEIRVRCPLPESHPGPCKATP